MSIPKFKPAKHYLGEYNIPCRLAKVKNSKLSGIATRAIVKSKEDPICEIYLHGKGAKNFSAWEKGILEQIFDGRSLAALVDSAMKGYAKDPSGYTSAKPAEQEEIQKIGIAPFMTIYQIAIDDKRKEAILSARTLLDLNLIEHGINIYLKKGKWHFSDAQYYIRYADKLGPTIEEEEEEEDDGPTPKEKLFSKLFPPAKKGTPVEKGCTALQGKWKCDQARTREILRAVGTSKTETDDAMAHSGEDGMEITPKTVAYYKWGIKPVWTTKVVDCERRGNWITMHTLIHEKIPLKEMYWLDDRGVIDRFRKAFKRVGPGETMKPAVKEYDGPMPENRISKLFPPAKRGTPVEKDSPALHGKWRFDSAGTRKIHAAAGVSTEETDLTITYGEEEAMEFTAKTLTCYKKGIETRGIRAVNAGEILGCQRHGNWIAVRLLIDSRLVMTLTFWLDDDGSLVNVSGSVFRRIK